MFKRIIVYQLLCVHFPCCCVDRALIGLFANNDFDGILSILVLDCQVLQNLIYVEILELLLSLGMNVIAVNQVVQHAL